MNVAFALFADAANLSQEGKLNILGVFDAVQVSTLPAVHPRAHMVVRLTGTRTDVGEHRVTFRWLNPSGSELWSSTGELSVATPPSGASEIDLPLIAAVDLPVDQAGAFRMQIGLDGQERGEIRLQVRSAAPLPGGGLVS